MTLTRVNIAQAEAELSDLVDRALRGEDITIARRGPLVRLVAVQQAQTGMPLGVLAGLVEVGADFDDPLDDFDEHQ